MSEPVISSGDNDPKHVDHGEPLPAEYFENDALFAEYCRSVKSTLQANGHEILENNNQQISEAASERPKRVISCEHLAKDYFDNDYTLDEYCREVMSCTIGADKKLWDLCIDTIPFQLISEFLEYLRVHVVERDYKPNPSFFVYGGETTFELEQIKTAMRPKYVEFVNRVREQLTRKL